MSKNKFNEGQLILSKNKVALTKIDEKINTTLAIPQTYRKDFVLAVVEGYNDVSGISFGDTVMFQIAGDYMEKNCTCYVNGEPVIIINKGDMLARLDSNIITLEGFNPLGKWVLLRTEYKNKSEILIPDAHKQHGDYVFYVEKIGTDCGSEDLGLTIGDNVIPDNARVVIIKIDGNDYVLIHVSNIFAIVNK